MTDGGREQIDMIDALIFVKRWRWRIVLGASLGLLLALGYTLQRGAVYTVRVPVSIVISKSDAEFDSSRIVKTFQAALISPGAEYSIHPLARLSGLTGAILQPGSITGG